MLFGVGTTDLPTRLCDKDTGKTVRCPFYTRWHSMLRRCYYTPFKEKHPTYSECHVCGNWLTFSNFKEWMEEQEWSGNHLDKDILFNGNRCYSQETSRFIHPIVNVFVTDRANGRGDYLLGASRETKTGKFIARCRNPFTEEEEYLGLFSTEEQAHDTWKNRKRELSILLANSSFVWDEGIRQALIKRY